ncbi:hypothetical protein DL765_007951 [Monosporascus sp. GIB2]|nr:hypothetical protein DL765_007951 [Monosporascus sp. GIB2]
MISVRVVLIDFLDRQSWRQFSLSSDAKASSISDEELLAKYGFINGAFNRISDELKNTPLIREQQTYDVVRLSPDALQELALQLLREEQRQEAEAAEKNWGGLSPNSRKRKLQSPPLPTLEEAHRYTDGLPKLVDRLYARFRENIVRGIREDEQRIEALQREIGEIERGEWDNRANSRPETQAAIKAAPVAIGDANLAARPWKDG